MAKSNKPAKTISFLKLPAPKKVVLPVESLVFDRTLQHRSKLVDEETVNDYAELAGAGTVFPALEAVHQTTDENGEPCSVYWVYDGFQRGAAYKKAKIAKCEVEVIKGDYDTAYFLSLSSNRDHGLTRTSEDKKRTVFALLDNPKALEIVLSKAKGNGGAHRVIGAACGCSAAWVDEALKERDLSAKGDKLVKRRAPATPAAPAKPDAIIAPVPPSPAPPAAPPDPKAERKANDAAYRAMCEANFVGRIDEAAGRAKRIAVLLSTLITDPEHGQLVKGVLREQGLSVSDEFDVRAEKDGKDFQPYYEILELWPVSVKLGALFAALKKAHAEKTAPPPAPEPTPEVPAEPSETPPAPEPESNGKHQKGKKVKAKREPAATE